MICRKAAAGAKLAGLVLTVAFMLSGCMEASSETSAKLTVLRGKQLEAYMSGTKISLAPQFAAGLDPVEITLRPDKTGQVVDGEFRATLTWRVKGQDLCLIDDENGPTKHDCMTIGWIDGDRFGAFGERLGEVKLMGIGTVKRP